MASATSYKKITPYVTKDGSTIRELMHPDVHGNVNQSLAEAVVPIRGKTILHTHGKSEEIYHFTEGIGVMTLGKEQFDVIAGDTVSIPPGIPHSITNTGNVPLRVLCCCSPAYSHGDTRLVEERARRERQK